MPRVNIDLSHLNIERELAELLQTAISRDFIGLADFFVSSDRTTIPAGDKWLPNLIQGLAKSDLHMVLCSPESVRRPWINFETGAACLKGIPVIPIVHSGLSARQLGPPLSEFESVGSDLEGLQKLYRRIASFLSSTVPDANLAELASKIETFETGYQEKLAVADECASTPTSVVTIRSPQVLCVTSNQFLSLRPDDFTIIRAAFPETATHRREVSSRAVRDSLMREDFDIVHVATYVCPKTGDLIFSDIDFDELGEQKCQPEDVLTAEAFISLIKNAQTKLVVIASCESFELAAELLSVCDVIATRDMISAEMFAAWIENFYQALQVKTLSEAFDFGVKASRAPMKLYAKQNFVIRKSDRETAAAV